MKGRLLGWSAAVALTLTTAFVVAQARASEQNSIRPNDSVEEPIIDVIGGTNDDPIRIVSNTIAKWEQLSVEAIERPLAKGETPTGAAERSEAYRGFAEDMREVLAKLCAQAPPTQLGLVAACAPDAARAGSGDPLG